MESVRKNPKKRDKKNEEKSDLVPSAPEVFSLSKFLPILRPFLFHSWIVPYLILVTTYFLFP